VRLRLVSIFLVSKERFSLGVISIGCVINPDTGNYNVLVGTGDGTLAYMNPSLNSIKV
jgi:hypothetical protein